MGGTSQEEQAGGRQNKDKLDLQLATPPRGNLAVAHIFLHETSCCFSAWSLTAFTPDITSSYLRRTALWLEPEPFVRLPFFPHQHKPCLRFHKVLCLDVSAQGVRAAPRHRR